MTFELLSSSTFILSLFCRSFHVKAVWYFMENFLYWSVWVCGRNTKFVVACLVEWKWVSVHFCKHSKILGGDYLKVYFLKINSYIILYDNSITEVKFVCWVVFIFKTFYVNSFILNLREFSKSQGGFFLASDLTCLD